MAAPRHLGTPRRRTGQVRVPIGCGVSPAGICLIPVTRRDGRGTQGAQVRGGQSVIAASPSCSSSCSSGVNKGFNASRMGTCRERRISGAPSFGVREGRPG